MDRIETTSRDPFLFSFDRVEMATRRAGAFRLTDVQPTGIQWLWPGRIPLGYVTLLVSDPGAGKSLVALDVAARVSTGAPWPDECSRHIPCAVTDSGESQGDKETARQGATASDPALSLSPCLPVSLSNASQSNSAGTKPARISRCPSSVLVLNIEDHFANTVRPRLDALGADCSRIIGLSHVPGEGVFNMPRPVAINRDVNRIEMLVREIRDCRLIILDPITAFFGETSNRSTGNVWKVLSNFSWLAASANLAVLAVSHLRKKEGAAIHRALGSLAFMAAARAAWTIAPDPAHASRRLFLPLKNNLAESAGGLAFTIESTTAGGVPFIRWLSEPIETRADDVLASNRPAGRPDDERQYAIDWLRTRLSGGAFPVREIRNDADAHGIGYGTLRRAFRELDCEAIRVGRFPYGEWKWKLPAVDA